MYTAYIDAIHRLLKHDRTISQLVGLSHWRAVFVIYRVPAPKKRLTDSLYVAIKKNTNLADFYTILMCHRMKRSASDAE